MTVDWAYTVAISVFAFSRNGAAGVGLVTLIRLLPAAATAPFTAGLGDRFPRRLLLAGEELIIGLILATTAIVAMVRGPDLLVYALAQRYFGRSKGMAVAGQLASSCQNNSRHSPPPKSSIRSQPLMPGRSSAVLVKRASGNESPFHRIWLNGVK